MISRSPDLNDPPLPVAGLSNRVVQLALAGILFLTLFPFRFTLPGKLSPGASPFLLGFGEKSDSALDIFLNIVLFIPLGFGLSEKLRVRGWSWKRVILATWIAGSFLSYTIEFLQIYIPTRDSGWEDVVTNGAGAAVGAAFFALCGPRVVSYLTRLDRLVRASLTLRRAVVILCVYFGVWFAVSASLQKETRLDDWSPQSHLYLAGEPQVGMSPAWKGTISQLKLWNLALTDDDARALTQGTMPDSARRGLLASYVFSSGARLQDEMGFLPDLTWTPAPPALAGVRGIELDGRSWLASREPVSIMVTAVQQTNQFSLLIACTPASFTAAQRIVSIAQPSGAVDLLLRQDDASLVFWFRNPLSIGHALLAWNIPNIFFAGQPRSILLSYNGSNLSLFVDGLRDFHVYTLGPGVRLAELVRRVKPAELEGYNYIYDVLIFFPAGAFLGIAITTIKSRKLVGYSSVAALFLLPPWIFDQILGQASHRSASFGTVVLCFILAVGGSLWINSDRSPEVAPDEK
jgi:VanZ family protein